MVFSLPPVYHTWQKTILFPNLFFETFPNHKKTRKLSINIIVLDSDVGIARFAYFCAESRGFKEMANNLFAL